MLTAATVATYKPLTVAEILRALMKRIPMMMLKTVEEMQQVLVKVLAFNPLRTEETRKVKLLTIPTVEL